MDFFWFAALSLVIVTGVFVVARRHEVGAVDRGDARAGVAHRLGGIAGRRPVSDRRPGRVARGESRDHSPVAAAVDHPRDAGISRAFCSTPARRRGSACCCASPIIGLWYWCTDQYIVQRVLTARESARKRAAARCSRRYLKLAPVFIFLLPGMIAVALFKQGTPGFETIGNNPQGAFPMLVSNLLPVGLRGPRARRHAVGADERAGVAVQLDRHAVHRGLLQAPASAVEREAPGVRRPHRDGGASSCSAWSWIPFLQDLGKGQLYTYLQLVQSLLAPSIAAVFMAGIFSTRVTPKSGLIGIATGFVVGMLRLVLQAMHEMYGIEWPGLDPGIRRRQLAVLQLPAVRVHLRR